MKRTSRFGDIDQAGTGIIRIDTPFDPLVAFHKCQHTCHVGFIFGQPASNLVLGDAILLTQPAQHRPLFSCNVVTTRSKAVLQFGLQPGEGAADAVGSAAAPAPTMPSGASFAAQHQRATTNPHAISFSRRRQIFRSFGWPLKPASNER